MLKMEDPGTSLLSDKSYPFATPLIVLKLGVKEVKRVGLEHLA
jgi:hypothetical protein